MIKDNRLSSDSFIALMNKWKELEPEIYFNELKYFDAYGLMAIQWIIQQYILEKGWPCQFEYDGLGSWVGYTCEPKFSASDPSLIVVMLSCYLEALKENT